ncbi:MAG: DedA family protein [Candidatus Aenigmarchaeota archaeon]|nr:DedA family protein [Candidatus Aenigmarchaeota archaeon]
MVLAELVAGPVMSIISQIGYVGVFLLMVFESALLPVPSEIIMPFSGFLVATGRIDFWLVVLAGTLGNLVGSLISYFIGKSVGRNLILKYGKYVFIHESHLDMADRWFEKFGDRIILLSRNLPAVRTYISLPAGITRMNLLKFSLYTAIGSLPWNTFLTYIGVILGENWQTILQYTSMIDIIVVVLAIVMIVMWLKKK